MILSRPTYAPGSRLVIRDEEWLVKSALPHTDTASALRVLGLSELVRGHEAVFLSDLEKIEELHPEKTTLAGDDSPQYRRTRLFLESLLRRTPPTDDLIYLGHQGALNPAPYQLEPAHLALKALRPRILIADGVGLGKTVEVGILLSDLIKRGRGERILVVAIRSMLAQFQQEIWARFAIPLVRLDSVGIQRVRAKIPASKNPFTHYDRAIISIDTLKNDAQYRHYLEECHWDVIVIDECHNVANAGSQRNRLAALLARTCDSLILTSATPHNGRAESFANLIHMLEPTAIADAGNYSAEEIQGLFTRRFKKDIEEQVAAHFQERRVHLEQIPAGPAEEAVFAALESLRPTALHRPSVQDALFRIGLLKAFLSSPDACRESLDGRLRRVRRQLAEARGEAIPDDPETGSPDEASGDLPAAHIEAPEQNAIFEEMARGYQRITSLQQELNSLTDLLARVQAVDAAAFSKYQRLLALLREWDATGSPSSRRVILFSERIATLRFLQAQLQQDLSPRPDAVALFHAGLPDVEQQAVVDSFGKEDSPIRILLASDVASEGVNLHYYCHLMIHFDIPWSLITLEQRNGRIDRYGQQNEPHIHYLLTLSRQPGIKADLRVLERLIEKEEEAHKNIGDAATVLGLHDPTREEEHITRGVARGDAVESILPDSSPEADWLAILMGGAAGEAAPQDPTAASFSLYADDLDFAKAAFAELLEAGQLERAPDYHPDRPAFDLLAPEDLRRRCAFLPQEAIPDDWTFHLTSDRQRVMDAMAQARRQEGVWPQAQLFWELHPAMEWLLDRLLVRFNRHEAPLVVTPKAMHPREFLLLFQGVLSNRRSQPLITDWFGIIHDERGFGQAVYSLEEVLKFSGFDRGLPNPGKESGNQPEIAAALPQAVDLARAHMDRLRLERGQTQGSRLRDDMRKLRHWRDATADRLQRQRADAIGARAARLEHELAECEALYQQRQQWLQDSFIADPTPYLRLAAVFTGR